MNFVRVVMADYVPNSGSLAGDIISDSQPYTLTMLNIAWRKLQRRLARSGHPRLTREVNITGLPAVATLDPTVFASLSWTGYYDGTTTSTDYLLPQDLIMPLRLYERQNGFTLSRENPMNPVPDGLPSWQKGSNLKVWEWREDQLWLIGSILATDLRISYAAYLADIAVGQGETFLTVQVPILRAAEPLAYYTAEAFIEPRGGSESASVFAAKGDKAADDMCDQSAKQQQRAVYRRKPYGSSSTNFR